MKLLIENWRKKLHEDSSEDKLSYVHKELSTLIDKYKDAPDDSPLKDIIDTLYSIRFNLRPPG
tara:strand:- start:195 stop:383 length:189 start_codon:yes stop_codon:yes gene_type:complete